MGANDIAAKDLEAFPDVAADLLNVLLHDGVRHIRAENLLSAPTETLYQGSGENRSQLEDLAKYKFANQKLMAVYLLANQMTVDSRMLIRKAGYTGGYYREQYEGKAHGNISMT